MFKLLVENRIGKQGQEYKCWLCNCTLPLNDFEVVERHIHEDQHKAIVETQAWDKIDQRSSVKKLRTFSEEEYKELVENNIIFKIKEYYCNLCRCTLSVTEEHIEGKLHKLRYEHKNNRLIKTKPIDKNLKVENIYKSAKAAIKDIKFVESTNTYICQICECSFSEINNVFVHIENVHRYNLSKQKEIPANMFHKTNCDLYCKNCGILLGNNETLIQCHCLLHLYKENPKLNMDIVEFQFDDNKVKISCLICGVTVFDDRAIAAHLEEQNHFDRLSLWKRFMRKSSWRDISETIRKKTKYLQELDNNIFCPDDDFEIHVKDDKNKISINLEDYDKFYKCFLCNKSFDSVITLIKHYSTFMHSNKLTTFCSIKNRDNILSKDNKSNEQLLNNNPSSSNTVSLAGNGTSNLTNVAVNSSSGSKDVHVIANKLVNKKEKIAKKIREGRNQLFYNEDLLDIAEEYVLMCLEPGNNNIFNIDSGTINQLTFGTFLTVPYECKRICIPCGYKFLPGFYNLCEHLQHENHILNMCDMISSSEKVDNNKDQLSYLDLAESCIDLEETNGQIKCYACEKSLPNSHDELKHHMITPTHWSKMQSLKQDSHIINEKLSIFLKNLWYYVDKFSCKLCNVYFNREISFVKHLKEIQHISKIVPENQKEQDIKINICLGCCSCWFGLPNYNQHYEEHVHIQTVKQSISELPQIPKVVVSFLKNSVNIVESLIKDSNEIVNKQQHKQQQLLKSAENTVKPIYPNAKAYAFGSRISYLGFATSDVDVFIDCEEKYFQIGSKEASQMYIRTTVNEFCKKNASIWKKEKILLNPRVPIIKLKHKPTRLKCDISFLSGLGVEKSKLIRNYVIAYELCRKLILYLKRWFLKCNLYGPQAVNAYAISLYAIFFLQIKGIFPSVKKLIEWENQSKLVDGWECGFLETVPVTESTMNYSFKDILQGFFSFYAEFNYCTDVVCPLLGKILKKQSFFNINKLPEGMEIYKHRIENEEIEFFRWDSPMCIQDPVDLTQNITKAISKVQLRYFRSYCAQSLQILLE